RSNKALLDIATTSFLLDSLRDILKTPNLVAYTVIKLRIRHKEEQN
ncbi:MAG: hypothetical protein ACI9P7_002191, partial [Candidatus Azotimanducaceae bacterium]